MRVIHIIPDINQEAAGPSYSVVRLCESLIEQGQQIDLAMLDVGPIPLAPPFLKAFPFGRGPSRLGRSPTMKKWLDEQASSKHVDILHNHGMWQMNAVYPGWVARRRNIRYVVSPRGAFSEWAMQYGSVMKKFFWPALQRPSLANANCFHATAISEYVDIRRLGFRQPVSIIPNGIDIPKLPVKQPRDFRTLLFLGRIHPVKGLDMLLPAWRAVQGRFPEWRLRIVGPGNPSYISQMQQLAGELCLQRVEFSGALFGNQKWQAYHEADLFILPSYSENFGMVVAEALAAGTPAIVTHGAPWSGLKHHSAGWWIDIGVDTLVACLEEALGSPAVDLLTMGEAGSQWMQEDFSWNRIAEMMFGTYDWLLHQTTPPAWIKFA